MCKRSKSHIHPPQTTTPYLLFLVLYWLLWAKLVFLRSARQNPDFEMVEHRNDNRASALSLQLVPPTTNTTQSEPFRLVNWSIRESFEGRVKIVSRYRSSRYMLLTLLYNHTPNNHIPTTYLFKWCVFHHHGTVVVECIVLFRFLLWLLIILWGCNHGRII